MKFSFLFLRKLINGLTDKDKLLEILNLYIFESEWLKNDTLEVSIPANRYSDAACHWGLAQEIAVALKTKAKIPNLYLEGFYKKYFQKDFKKLNFQVEVLEEKLCPRYLAQFFDNIEVKASPLWLQKVLKSCGLKPINNVVDIMNYVMLETGQPLHAFDYDKLKDKKIIVRRAYPHESFLSLDNLSYQLNPEVLVIADSQKAQAIAGIKGGKEAAVDKNTKRILVEAANFEPVSIYKSSKKLNLTTDASLRFAHGLSLSLPLVGLKRAFDLLKEFAKAKPGYFFDSKPFSPKPKLINFSFDDFEKLVGQKFNQGEIESLFKLLGFKKQSKNLVAVPFERKDLENTQDLVEELIRYLGYNRLPKKPPVISLKLPVSEENLSLKDRIREFLTKVGLSEVYNYSFSFKGEVELLNPSAEDKKYLRPTLLFGLLKNLEDNYRFFEEVKIFEIGKVFYFEKKSVREELKLGLALGSKKQETFFALKGILENLLNDFGFQDIVFEEFEDFYFVFSKGLRIKIGREVIGYLGLVSSFESLAEISLEKIKILKHKPLKFKEFSRFPAVKRDLSFLVTKELKVKEIIDLIKKSNSRLIKEVDLIDEYFSEKWPQLKSLTLRIIFQLNYRTLTSEEVNKEVEEIQKLLERKYNVVFR